MLMPKTKQVFPIVGIALTASQNTKKNLMNSLDAYLVGASGTVMQIKSIKRLGFFGKTIKDKLKSSFFGLYSLDVRVEKADIDFDSLIKMIDEYLKQDLFSENPIFEVASKNPANTITSIKNAESIDDVFRAIRMPKWYDCIDML